MYVHTYAHTYLRHVYTCKPRTHTNNGNIHYYDTDQVLAL